MWQPLGVAASTKTDTNPVRVRVPPRERQKAETRARIVEAAESLFHDRGYRLVTLDEVGDRAGGYSKGAVYTSFATKADLLMAVLERDFIGVSNALATALRGTQHPSEIVAALTSWYRSHFQTEGTWSRSLPDLVASARYDAAARDHLAVHLRHVEDTIAGLLVEQEQRLGVQFAIASPTVAALAIATFHGLAVRSLVSGDDLSGLFADAMAALLHTRATPTRTEEQR